jgi:hypothetical protein
VKKPATVGRPSGSARVVTTPGGLWSRYQELRSGGLTSVPSTVTRSPGATLVPKVVTIWLFTATRPAVINPSA